VCPVPPGHDAEASAGQVSSVTVNLFRLARTLLPLPVS
jgi:hypothetical protein